MYYNAEEAEVRRGSAKSLHIIGLTGESVVYKWRISGIQWQPSGSFIVSLFILYLFSNPYGIAKLLQNCGDFGEDLIKI